MRHSLNPERPTKDHHAGLNGLPGFCEWHTGMRDGTCSHDELASARRLSEAPSGRIDASGTDQWLRR
ncbi:MAG: hypothetical protein CMO80_14230 [Verrucomicrobiales bacterium]|nr:hypothetical protein [Verrucomicrobiales bacterium]